MWRRERREWKEGIFFCSFDLMEYSEKEIFYLQRLTKIAGFLLPLPFPCKI